MLTVTQAAKRLNVSGALIYALIASGRMQCHRIGLRRGCVRISEAQLQAYLDSTRQERAKQSLPVPVGLKHITL